MASQALDTCRSTVNSSNEDDALLISLLAKDRQAAQRNDRAMARLPTGLNLLLGFQLDELTPLDRNLIARLVESGRSFLAHVLLLHLARVYADGIYCTDDSCGSGPDSQPCNDCGLRWEENLGRTEEVARRLLPLARLVTAPFTKLRELGHALGLVYDLLDGEDGPQFEERVERAPSSPIATVHVLAGPSRDLAPPRTAFCFQFREAA